MNKQKEVRPTPSECNLEQLIYHPIIVLGLRKATKKYSYLGLEHKEDLYQEFWLNITEEYSRGKRDWSSDSSYYSSMICNIAKNLLKSRKYTDNNMEYYSPIDASIDRLVYDDDEGSSSISSVFRKSPGGRNRIVDRDKVIEYRHKGVTNGELSKMYCVTKRTIKRIFNNR